MTTPALSISLRLIGGLSLPIVTVAHRCPKCDGELDEIHAHDDHLVGWECGVCGYRNIIREGRSA